MGAFRILVLRSDDPLRDGFEELLSRRGHHGMIVSDLEHADRAARAEGADLAVVSLPLRGERARTVVPTLRSAMPGVPIVVIGLDDDVQVPSDAFGFGAQEHLPDVADGHALLSTIGLLLGARRIDSQLRYLIRKEAADATLDAIAGESAVMVELRRVLGHLLRRSGPGARPPILLTGETGTGKGLVAKTLHYQGARRNAPFVDVNCAAIPASLIESELFGYERGAFTDAHAGRAGLFETANGGTLFLDEISSMPIELQGKLLTAVEEQLVRRIGARKGVSLDVQVIAATHRDLASLVREGTFRQDLYHRLDVLSVRIPPLRERSRDASVLATRFLAELCARYGIERRFSSDALEAINRYPWPGNVRELRNRIERAILLGSGEIIAAGHLEAHPLQASAPHAAAPAPQTQMVPGPGGTMRVVLPEDGIELDDVERAVILEALRMNEHNVSATARFLRVGRQKLMYRMRRHGIEDCAES